MILKPIETRYAGYLMRSRLEARWAFFLDHLRIPYEYELEGFDPAEVAVPGSAVALTGRDGWYLPDFWLPRQGTWLEIKPEPPSPVERERAARLAIASRHDVIIVVGTPWIVAERPNGYSGGDSGHLFRPDGTTADFYLLTACPLCRRIDWCHAGWAHELRCDCANAVESVGDFGRVQRAYVAARSARFEGPGRENEDWHTYGEA